MLPWVALLLAGMAGVVVITLLVLGGGDDSSDPLPPPDDTMKTPEPKPAPSKSARELLEGPDYGYVSCGRGAFKRGNTSDAFCLAVAEAVRLDPESSFLPGVPSTSTGELYDMECRGGNADEVLLKYRFCTEVGTTDPRGVGTGDDVAQVVVRP